MEYKKWGFFLTILLCSFQSLHSLDGKWEFRNLFFQLIEPGNITFQNFQYNVIEYIIFTETSVYTSGQEIKKATINMMADGDINKTYECNYMDMGSLILLQINTEHGLLDIVLYIVNNEENIIWYSFSMSIELEQGRVRGKNENDTKYLNFIGVMTRSSL